MFNIVKWFTIYCNNYNYSTTEIIINIFFLFDSEQNMLLLHVRDKYCCDVYITTVKKRQFEVFVNCAYAIKNSNLLESLKTFF